MMLVNKSRFTPAVNLLLQEQVLDADPYRPSVEVKGEIFTLGIHITATPDCAAVWIELSQIQQDYFPSGTWRILGAKSDSACCLRLPSVST